MTQKWFEKNNEQYYKLIHSRRWRELRKRKLEATIWCEDCRKEGRRELATEVHHITPVASTKMAEQMKRLAFDYGNLIALCRACHIKRHEHSRAMQRERSVEVAEKTAMSFVQRFFGKSQTKVQE